jgi:group I intron endonuclease
MKIRGIYKIQSQVKPQCVYIGSSEDIYSRWSKHRREMFYNKHKNSKIQNHYNKYGLDDFIFEIIEECSLEDKLPKEQYYIDTFKPWFNINLVAGNSTGRKFSEETLYKFRNPSESTLLKMRNARLGRKFGKQTTVSKLKGVPKSAIHVDRMRSSSKGIPILQYNLDGTFIKEWFGLKTASKALLIPPSSIRDCLKLKNKQSHGFIWKYK